MTTMVGTSMPRAWPWRRAILIAASLASAPELPKNTLSMPLIPHSIVASSCWAGML
jgi:hypothetical protein